MTKSLAVCSDAGGRLACMMIYNCVTSWAFTKAIAVPDHLGLLSAFVLFDLTLAFISVAQPWRSRKQKLYPQFAADGFMYRAAMAANCEKQNYSFL
jgi:hypothetical protein